MRAPFRAIGWSLAGSVIAGAVTFAAVLVYDHLFEPSDHADVRAWQTVGAAMAGLGSALTVLMLGAVCGIARALSRPRGRP
jgi:hypothetical protein